MKNGFSNSKEFADYDYLQSASAMDATGLIPAAPENETERRNYESLYPILPRVALRNDVDYVEDDTTY